MGEAEVAPRKRLIIKLRLPHSRTLSSEECKLKDDVDTEKRGPEFMASDSCGEKRKKDQYCSTTEYSLQTEEGDDGADSRKGGKRRKLATSEVSVFTKSSVQEHHNACSRIPRTGSTVLDSKNKKEEEKEHHNACSKIPRTGSKNPKNRFYGASLEEQEEKEEEHHNACSRIPRTGSKVLDSKNTKKEEEMKVVLNEHRMDRYQKIQCWMILKRFMVGRDGWAFNKTLYSKKLGILGNNCESVLLMKPIGFEEIE
ncbi:uncharacterized protein LOC110263672 [Arachis ipaensis]|uniref:uncharacterized protein LOC110263672 n=1 Tax=Arachis ipaensis TaxID=130454 RepID=UPI000A2B4998|nr:uncharacterized protein LOC110263672 [Arachis ipaensis]